MARAAGKEPTLDLRAVIAEVGVPQIMEHVGVKQALEALGLKRVIEEGGLDQLLAQLTPEQRQEVVRRLQ
jgi:hypothetical protein